MASHLTNGDQMRRKMLCQSTLGDMQKGFAYVLVLVTIAVLGIAAAKSLSLGSLVSRRDAEQSLLAIGGEFETALISYARIGTAATAPNTRGPRALEDLLKDPRSASIRRHLRQIYLDPLSGSSEWGLVKDSAGFIVGVYSLADGQPIKRSGFDAKQPHFEEAQSYNSWIFGLPEAARIAAATGSISAANTLK